MNYLVVVIMLLIFVLIRILYWLQITLVVVIVVSESFIPVQKMNTAHSKLDGVCVHYMKAVVFLISRGLSSLYQGGGLHIMKRKVLI